MSVNRIKKTISIGLTGSIVLLQVLFFSLASAPSVAHADDFPLPSTFIPPSTIAITVPTTTALNIPDQLDNKYIAIMRGIAFAAVQKFTSVFINKLTEKYKIRNYLYYDQVLTNYYLSNYISDKIQDPNLRQIYGLMNAGYVTGQSTGTTGGPDPNKALIPRLKTAINNYYQNNFGVSDNVITNNPNNLSGYDYYSTAFSYYLNPPGYVYQNLQGQFGAFQSAATTAAQLEVIVGNSLKAGRVVGGFCSNTTDNVSWGDGWAPASCVASGGKWNASALDNARSFIDNPTTFINNWLQGVISSQTNTNFDPNNFWYAIGGALGNFLLNSLTASSSSSAVINEDPNHPYVPSNNGGITSGANIDIDGDGIADGFSVNNNGIIDNCFFGGTAPNNCVGSKTALAPPPAGGTCTVTSTGTAGTQPDSIDLNSVVYEAGSPNVAGWAQTATITNPDLSANGSIDFTKKDGPDRWPDQPYTAGSADTIQYTIWYFLYIDGQWYGAAVVDQWFGRPGNGGGIYNSNPPLCNWATGSQYGPMFGHMIVPGEKVGIMVTAGGVRQNHDSNIKERSDVVVVPAP
ncbi:MAG: hypothetical protein WDN47_05050 [Candidatus Doudnabacteria bacterium]